MRTNQGGKFTDIKRGFVKMLESYKQIRKLIHKLTNKNFHHINDIDVLILEAESVRKIKQRETRHFAELQMIQEAENKIKSYLNKNETKIRRYDVYSHVICFLDLIWGKITEFVPKNIDICRLTPQMMRWKLFLSQLNESKQAMHGWLKQIPQENKKSRQNQGSSTPFYKISTIKGTKLSTPSTAYMTMFETPLVQLAQKQQTKIEKKRFSYLKRSQSACKGQMNKIWSKNQRKNYPLKKRSPQDKDIDSNENSRLESPNRSKRFIRNSSKQKLFYRIEPQNIFSGSIEIIQIKQNNLNMREFKKKTSLQMQQNENIAINQQNSKINDSQQTQIQIAKAKYEAMINSKKLQRSQRRSSIRKIKQTLVQTQVNKSAFATKILEDVQNDEDLQEEQKDDEVIQQVFIQSGEKSKPNKRGKNKKMNFSFDVNDEQVQIENQTKIKTKKSAYLKKLKESLTYETNHPQYYNQTLPKKSAKDNKSKRRNGIISSKEMATVLGRLQTKIKQDEKEREMQLKKKTIQMNQRLINQLQIGQGTIIHGDEQNIGINQKPKKKQFDDFYRELTNLKIDQIKEAKANPWGGESSFFIQQNFLREQKSRQLQEYIKKLQTNNRSIGQVFEIKSQDQNIKIQNYMIMERKLAFQSQNQWIKNHHNTRIDTNDSIQLIQQEYPSSSIPQSIQRF